MSSDNKNYKFNFSISVILLYSVFVLLFLSLLFLPTTNSIAQAATRTWTGASSNLWNVDANWGGTKPVAGDDLVFPVGASNKSTNNDIAADTSFNSITLNGTGYTLAGNRITLGAGGITQTTGVNVISLAIVLGADIVVSVEGTVLTLSGIISEAGGARSVAKAGSVIAYFGGVNTFSGGTVVRQGVLSNLTTTGFGIGAITIGYDSADATLRHGSGGTVVNAVVLADRTSATGILTIDVGSTGTLSGGITGDNDLRIALPGSSGLILSTNSINHTGTITNSGSGTGATTISSVIGTNVAGVIQDSATSQLTLSGNNASYAGGVTIKSGQVNLSTSANAAGTGTITIGDSTGGTNAATLQSNTDLIYANPIVLASNTTGTLTIKTHNLNQKSNFSGGVTGNNNLVLKSEDTNGDDPLTLSGASVNNVGTITNLGSGNAATVISAVIGTNVTGVIQNSATSQLYLSGANTFTSGLTVKAGSVSGGTSATVFGNGSITIGDSSGVVAASIEIRSNLTYTNTISTGVGGVASITFGNYCELSGPITLNSNNLTINGNIGVAQLSGGITGTGNVMLNVGTGTAATLILKTSSINNVGTITNSGTGTGTTTISSVIGTNVTGVIQNSSTSQLTLSGANTFTSGLWIKAGTVRGDTSANAFGANGNTITIGNSSGTSDATLWGNANVIYSNPINVATGSSGILSIKAGVAYPTFTGLITLANNLAFTTTGAGAISFSGGIAGVGNVVISMISSGTISVGTNSINHTGTITNLGTGTGTSTISAVIGSNVTGLTQNSTTSKLVLSGNNSTISGDVNITAGTLELSGTTNLNVAGNWNNQGTFTKNSSTVTFTKASGTQTLNPGSSSFYNLTHSDIGTLQLTDNSLTTTGTLSNSSGTLDLAGYNLTSPTITLSDNTTFKLHGSETISTTPTIGTNNTFYYYGSSSSYTLKDYTYQNLTLASTNNTTYSIPSNTTIQNNLTINTNNILDHTTNHYTLSVDGTITNNGTILNRQDSYTSECNQTTIQAFAITSSLTGNKAYYIYRQDSPQEFNSGYIQSTQWQDTDPHDGAVYIIKYRNQDLSETTLSSISAPPTTCGSRTPTTISSIVKPTIIPILEPQPEEPQQPQVEPQPEQTLSKQQLIIQIKAKLVELITQLIVLLQEKINN